MNVGPTEILLLLILALILLGPKRIPELARSLGEAINEFRRASSGALAAETRAPPVREVHQTGKKGIRGLAEELGIDTVGKTDEELEKEILALIRGKKPDRSD